MHFFCIIPLLFYLNKYNKKLLFTLIFNLVRNEVKEGLTLIEDFLSYNMDKLSIGAKQFTIKKTEGQKDKHTNR